MLRLRLINRPGSAACRILNTEAGIRKYEGSSAGLDGLVNYGLPERELHLFYRRDPQLRRLPVINRYAARTKLEVIWFAQRLGIPIPETRKALSEKQLSTPNLWLRKSIRSRRGEDITFARTGKETAGFYYQRFISARAYEVRIAAFRWLGMERWGYFKRVGDPNTIAWNFHQGGMFINLRNQLPFPIRLCTEMVNILLAELHMGFGAFDFIVDRQNQIYFLEVNSAPGFTDFSKELYVHAFADLRNLTHGEFRRLAE